jgi:hypothetical protein
MATQKKELTFKALTAAVDALNASGLIEKPIRTNGIKREDIEALFIDACEHLPEGNTVPNEVGDVYRALKGIADAPPAPDADAAPKGGGKLLAGALKAYGIEKGEVFASTEYPKEGRVVLVTKGGKKINWTPADKDVKPLSYIERTGINPEAGKRKPIAGKKR